MSIRVFPKQYSGIGGVVQNTDKVLFALPLPPHSKLNNVNLDIRVIGTVLSYLDVAGWAVHGYVLPVLDPDSGITPDAMWDAQIPKDQAATADSLDLDTQTADTEPVVDIGDISVEQIVGMTTAPLQVFSRERFITYADDPSGYDRTAQDFIPTARFRAKIRRNIRVDVPSYFLIGFSSLNMGNTTVGWPVINTDGEWTQLAYMQETLHQAWLALVGLVATGTQEASTEAMQLIAPFLEVAQEDVASIFEPLTWRVIGKATYDITLKGTVDNGTLTAQPN